MPVPKRWFPISQDLNHDPEVWELTECFGDRALRIWVELLSWADKTENYIELPITWHSSLARITKTNSRTVVNVVLWMLDHGWLRVTGDQRPVDEWKSDLRSLCQDWPKTPRKRVVQRLHDGCTTVDRWLNNGRSLTLGTVNYWKYRKRREPSEAINGSPPLLSVSSLPNKTEKIAGSTSSSPANGTPKQRTTVMADEEFIAMLKKNPAYAGIDINREIGKIQAWLLTPKGRGKQLTRQRVVNWLNRIDTPLNGAQAQSLKTCEWSVGNGDGRRHRPCGKPVSSGQSRPFCHDHLIARERLDARLQEAAL
jgi:hypothetical protein